MNTVKNILLFGKDENSSIFVKLCVEAIVKIIDLVEPISEYAKDLWCFRREILNFDADSEDKFAGCMGLEESKTAEEWIGSCKYRKDEKKCKEIGIDVPTHIYLAIRKEDNKIVGIIHLRHHINHTKYFKIGVTKSLNW